MPYSCSSGVQETRAPSQALYQQSNECFRQADLAYHACKYQLSDELKAQVCPAEGLVRVYHAFYVPSELRCLTVGALARLERRGNILSSIPL